MAEYLALWWVWIAGAIVLGILEMLLPANLFLGFAIGAAITGILVLITGSALSIPVLVLIFAAISLIAWIILQRVFKLPKGQVKVIHDDINDD